MIARPIYLILPLLLLALPCAAQPADSTARRTPPADTVRPAVTTGYVMTKNPTTATLLSIAPGLGQWYTEQYWKIPIFAGFAGWFGYRAITLNNLYLQKKREAEAVGRNSPLYFGLKLQREAYRDDRDLNIAYFVGVEILSMIDAYVGAHLFDFDVGDKISSKIQLYPSGLGLNVRF